MCVSVCECVCVCVSVCVCHVNQTNHLIGDFIYCVF